MMFTAETYDVIAQLRAFYSKVLVETGSKEVALSVTAMLADNLSESVKELYLDTLIEEIKDF